MQTLMIWPSSSEWNPCAMTQLSLELCSFTSFPHWGSRRKNLGFRPVSCRVVLHVRDYFKGFRNEASFIGRKCELNILLMENKGSLGTTFALPWALEESTVDDNVAKGGLDHNMIELTHGHLSENLEVSSEPANDDTGEDKDENHENDDGQNRGIDHWKEDQSGSSGRINVRALAWSLHLAKTEDDVEEVLKEKGELPLQVYCTIIKGFGKDKRLHSAMALYKWLRRKSKKSGSHIQLNLYIFNSLLGAMKQAENFNFLEEVVNDMAVEGVCPNVVTYNTLMGIYIEQGRELRALQLFVEMPIRAVTPSPASYSTVLLAYRRLEDGFGALTLFLDIRSNYQKGKMGKSSGEDWSYEIVKLEKFTLRICHQVMRRWLVTTRENLSTKVLKLLIDMDKAGMQPGRAEYERLLWACTREEHCKVAKELYARIRGMNVGISLSACNHIIWLMGKAKKWWAALEIYEDLLDKGPKPNNMSYELVVSHFNILLTAARKRGIWRWGMRLIDKMEEKGLKPGSKEWNSALIACSKASEASAAVEIFKRMVEQGEKPTIISYGALLSALEKGKLYDEAFQVWQHMMKVGVEPNSYAYTIMASIYAEQGKFDIVDSIIQEMVIVGVELTVVTFNAIITCCARHNLGSIAYEWFQRMKLQNVTPNEVTYEVLIEALAKDEKPRLAYEVYLRACNEGFELSTKAYDAVVESSQTYGATIDVGSLGPRPPERKKNSQR